MPAQTDNDRWLYALGVRIAAAAEFEAISLNGADAKTLNKRQHYLDSLRKHADSLLALDDTPVEELVDGIVSEIRTWKFSQCGCHADALNRARDALLERLNKGVCSHCGKRPMCPAQGEHPRCAGPCIDELYAVMDFVEKGVRQLYESHTGTACETHLHLCPEPVGEGEGSELFPQYHVNGWTDVHGDIVGVEIEEKRLNWKTLCQLVYIFAHELVCHAFQGLEGKAPRENASPHHCWSEGWMDALAWDFTEALFETDFKSLPEWCQTDLTSAKSACWSLHERRYEEPLQKMNAFHITQRRNARSAFRDLCRAWQGESKKDLGRCRAEAFSIKLNFASLTSIEREEIVARLGIALSREKNRNNKRFESIINACGEFSETGNAQAFRTALHDLAMDRGPSMLND
ncbi:hypothetical protein BYI23_C000480 [Burkholderia sp. YI23]|nr:hypothetical protein BYI23_C000480 [Burkholderia sp. YI23]